MENVRTSNLVSRDTFKELQNRSNLAWETLLMVRGIKDNEDGLTFGLFLRYIDDTVEFIECAAWEAAEKNTEAGKNLFKLCDVARYFSASWKKNTPSSVDELERVEDVRGYIELLANSPLSVPSWEGLEEIAGSEVVANAGKKVNLGGLVLNVDDVCREEPVHAVEIVDEEEQIAIKDEALKKASKLIEFVDGQEYSTRQANDFCALCAMRGNILDVWAFDEVENGVRRVKNDLEKRGAIVAPYLVEILDLYKNKRAAE